MIEFEGKKAAFKLTTKQSTQKRTSKAKKHQVKSGKSVFVESESVQEHTDVVAAIASMKPTATEQNDNDKSHGEMNVKTTRVRCEAFYKMFF